MPDTIDTVKELLWDTLIEGVLSSLLGGLPGFLSAMIIGVVTVFTDKIYAALALIVDLRAIVFKVEGHRIEYDRASMKLKLVAREKGKDSPEYKAARNENKKALARLVHFDIAG
jgi:hypothetical protein